MYAAAIILALVLLFTSTVNARAELKNGDCIEIKAKVANAIKNSRGRTLRRGIYKIFHSQMEFELLGGKTQKALELKFFDEKHGFFDSDSTTVPHLEEFNSKKVRCPSGKGNVFTTYQKNLLEWLKKNKFYIGDQFIEKCPKGFQSQELTGEEKRKRFVLPPISNVIKCIKKGDIKEVLFFDNKGTNYIGRISGLFGKKVDCIKLLKKEERRGPKKMGWRKQFHEILEDGVTYYMGCRVGGEKTWSPPNRWGFSLSSIDQWGFEVRTNDIGLMNLGFYLYSTPKDKKDKYSNQSEKSSLKTNCRLAGCLPLKFGFLIFIRKSCPTSWE